MLTNRNRSSFIREVKRTELPSQLTKPGRNKEHVCVQFLRCPETLHPLVEMWDVRCNIFYSLTLSRASRARAAYTEFSSYTQRENSKRTQRENSKRENLFSLGLKKKVCTVVSARNFPHTSRPGTKREIWYFSHVRGYWEYVREISKWTFSLSSLLCPVTKRAAILLVI